MKKLACAGGGFYEKKDCEIAKLVIPLTPLAKAGQGPRLGILTAMLPS